MERLKHRIWVFDGFLFSGLFLTEHRPFLTRKKEEKSVGNKKYAKTRIKLKSKLKKKGKKKDKIK